MPRWPRNPSILEINTWVWISDLSRKYGAFLNLASIPSSEWQAVAELGFDAVWLMGVWERSPAGVAIGNANRPLLDSFRNALPDFHTADNVGSAYCVRRYVVDSRLGGRGALEVARRELAQRGMRLVLDFVPNHVAPDHPWTIEHPEYFIRGDASEAERDPDSFLTVAGSVFARGRDPYFPAWPDVLQLNAFHPGYRQAAHDTVAYIASQCDGVRCDMAMLMLNAIVSRTWGSRAGAPPPAEYWPDLVAAVRAAHPDFVFIAEAYWDLEWELQQQGFDFCYDKRLYDRLHGDPENVRLHLCASLEFQEKLVRFVENHDEPRAAAVFSPQQQRAIAVTIATLPGARLFHEGQMEGRRVRVPVFLGRRPDESPDEELRAFYGKLLGAIRDPVFHEGQWRLCERTGWPDNASFRNILTWTWRNGDDRRLIVVNLSGSTSQARVEVPWDVGGRAWTLTDTLSGEGFERDGNEMRWPGLYVSLEPWKFHFFVL